MLAPTLQMLTLIAQSVAAQPADVNESFLLARLAAVCPSASAFDLGSPETDELTLRELTPGGFNADQWTHPIEPRPVVLSSPDRVAFVRITTIDSPPQIFVSSLVNSIGYANLEYLSAWHLLDAVWLDSHRFLLILAPRAGSPELELQVTVSDFRQGTKYTWHPSYTGRLPDSSAITARVSEIEHAVEARRAGHRVGPCEPPTELTFATRRWREREAPRDSVYIVSEMRNESPNAIEFRGRIGFRSYFQPTPDSGRRMVAAKDSAHAALDSLRATGESVYTRCGDIPMFPRFFLVDAGFMQDDEAWRIRLDAGEAVADTLAFRLVRDAYVPWPGSIVFTFEFQVPATWDPTRRCCGTPLSELAIELPVP